MESAGEDRALLDAYLTHIRVEKRLAARTQALYAAHLAALLQRAHSEGLSLLTVQAAHLRRWLAQWHAAGRQPRGLALMLSSWRGFYDWLGRNGRLQQHPLSGVRAPKADKPLPKALSVEAALQLATAPVSAAEGGARAQAEQLRDRAIVELLYGSGLRLGELLGLDVQPSAAARGWIDSSAAEVHVLGKGSKWRTVPVGKPALAALAAWLEARAVLLRHSGERALFVGTRGERLTPQVARRRLAAWARAAGLPMHVHPHLLRHSFASHLLQSSGDLRAVQELLGHASIASTQVYTRLDFQHLSRIYEAAHPRARRAPPSSATVDDGSGAQPLAPTKGNPGV